MAWIESHDSLVGHPKVDALCVEMGWDLDTSIGKLHRFWYWCLKYAENGDLRKFDDDQIGRAVDLQGDLAKKFVRILKKTGWCDREPYFRVHDWWDRVGPFLRSKYKRNPMKWQAVRAAYRPDEVDELQPVRNGYVTANQPNQPTILSRKEKWAEAKKRGSNGHAT